MTASQQMVLAHQALGSAIWGCDDLATVGHRPLSHVFDIDRSDVDVWYFALQSNLCTLISPRNLWHLDLGQSKCLDVLIAPQTKDGWPQHLDRIVSNLGRLKDGWAGPGSLAPTPAVLIDLETVLRVLPGDTIEPEVDVDPCDGSVIARWWSDDGKTAFAMSFLGNGTVYGITTCADAISPPAWHFSANEETKILDAIETRVGSVIAGK